MNFPIDLTATKHTLRMPFIPSFGELKSLAAPPRLHNLRDAHKILKDMAHLANQNNLSPSRIRLPPPLPPKEQCPIPPHVGAPVKPMTPIKQEDDGIKQEAPKNYASRSTSPIIGDDTMLKKEEDILSPWGNQKDSFGFPILGFNKRNSTPKCPSGRGFAGFNATLPELPNSADGMMKMMIPALPSPQVMNVSPTSAPKTQSFKFPVQSATISSSS